MDKNSIIALLSGIVMLIVAGSVFAITSGMSIPFPAIPSGPSGGITGMLLAAIRTGGRGVPYLIWLGGPIADIYYQEFRYSALSIISIGAMGVGLLYQMILGVAKNGVLPAFTVGTTAAAVYLIQDAWMQPIGINLQVVATAFGVLAALLSALVSTGGTVLGSALSDAGAALLLGAGIGELAWVIMYNAAPQLLPLAKK